MWRGDSRRINCAASLPSQHERARAPLERSSRPDHHVSNAASSSFHSKAPLARFGIQQEVRLQETRGLRVFLKRTAGNSASAARETELSLASVVTARNHVSRLLEHCIAA